MIEMGLPPVQHTNDGTHVILPATMHLRMPTDRAGLPVMWLRHADGKMRRDGVHAALLQRFCAAAERGKLHSASALMTIAAHRVMKWINQACRSKERKRECLRSGRRHDRLRRLFKSGFEIPVHGDNAAVAEFSAWCHDSERRCHKGSWWWKRAICAFRCRRCAIKRNATMRAA